MATAGGQSLPVLEEILRYTTATRAGAGNLTHAYKLGVPSGRRTPWPLEFQRLAVPIWLETCPNTYVAQIGKMSGRFATIMRSHELQDGPENGWAILLEQADAISGAVEEALDRSVQAMGDPPRAGGSPGLIRFDKLAALASLSGVARLERAAGAVAEYCRRRAYGDVTDEEIGWLRGLSKGGRTIEIAEQSGYSERAFYRRLQSLWGKLGVSGRAEGIATASQMGWMDDDCQR